MALSDMLILLIVLAFVYKNCANLPNYDRDKCHNKCKRCMNGLVMICPPKFISSV